jgi:hypothetical protein
MQTAMALARLTWKLDKAKKRMLVSMGIAMPISISALARSHCPETDTCLTKL